MLTPYGKNRLLNLRIWPFGLNRSENSSTNFKNHEFVKDPNSYMYSYEITLNKIGEFFTSMTNPLYKPGLVKEVNSNGVWIDKDKEYKESLIPKVGDFLDSHPLLLAEFGNGKYFIIIGQKRARALYELFTEGKISSDKEITIFILSNPSIGKYLEDLKYY